MLILGIDPGLATVGYGLIEKTGNKYKCYEYDVIRTEADKPNVNRLEKIYNELSNIIREFNPDHMAVEELFFNKNVKTAILVGQARGVILLAGSQSGLQVSEYTPLQVKQAVVGYGRARKEQVQEMVRSLLNLADIPKPDDAADALAVSICHGNSYSIRQKWGDFS